MNFGNNGWSSATFGTTSESASSVVIQPDGKIVVGGGLRNGVSSYEFAFVRFDSSGSIDTTFDGDGKVTIDFSDILPGFYAEVLTSLKITSDGRTDFAVYRPSTGTWYLQQTTAGFGSIQWGAATDIPTEHAFIP